MSRLGSLAHHLYSGEVSYDFVGKRRRWYAISGVILVLALVGLFGRGLNLGNEFKGGSEFTIPNTTASVQDVRTSVEKAGVTDPIVTSVGKNTIRVQTPALTPDQSAKVVVAKSSIDVPWPGRRGNSTVKPASAKACARPRIDCGQPVKPWSTNAPFGPPAADHGSAPGITAMKS